MRCEYSSGPWFIGDRINDFPPLPIPSSYSPEQHLALAIKNKNNEIHSANIYHKSKVKDLITDLVRLKSVPMGYNNYNEWLNHIKKRNISGNISDIPNDISLEYFMGGKAWYIAKRPQKGYLFQLCRNIQVCKEWRDYFNQDEFWKHAYIDIKIRSYYNNIIDTLSSKKVEEIETSNWDSERIIDNPIRLIIFNNSRLPYDIYWIKGISNKYYATIPSKGQFSCKTLPNHRWMCIPSILWLKKNRFEVKGYIYQINIFQQEKVIPGKYNIDKEDHAFVIRLEDQINKGIEINYSDYREKIIPLIAPDRYLEILNKNIQSLKKNKVNKLIKISSLKNEIFNDELRENNMKYIINILNK